jgi:hypothetical protein
MMFIAESWTMTIKSSLLPKFIEVLLLRNKRWIFLLSRVGNASKYPTADVEEIVKNSDLFTLKTELVKPKPKYAIISVTIELEKLDSIMHILHDNGFDANISYDSDNSRPPVSIPKPEVI